MGTVYEAQDKSLQTTVALKETHSMEEEFLKAFAREAQILAKLKHEALPKVIDHFGDEHNQFLVMEYISGQDLKQLQDNQRTPFSLHQVLTWAERLLDALQYLHTYQPPIIHRDVKPQNIKLTTDGKIVLLDFGLAKRYSTEASQSLYGYTMAYAPPEQIQGIQTDHRSDLFSLGATLYRLLTNEFPSNAEVRTEVVKQGVNDPLRPAHEFNGQLPPAISQVLHKALALKCEDRFQTAEEFRSALREATQTKAPVQSLGQNRRIQIEIPPPVVLPAPPPAKTPLEGKINQFSVDSFSSNSKPEPQPDQSQTQLREPLPRPVLKEDGLMSKDDILKELYGELKAEPVVTPPNFAVPPTGDFDTPGSATRRLLREKLDQKQRQNLPSFTDEPAPPVFEPPPTPTPRRPTGGADTRQLIAEAKAALKAAAEARQAAEAHQATEAQPVFDPMAQAKAKPDPEIEKMLGSGHIVHHQTGEHQRDTLERAKSSMLASTTPNPPPSMALGFSGRSSTSSSGGYQKPSILMLEVPPPRQEQKDAELWDRARLLIEKCREFNVTGKVETIHDGPVATIFEFKPDPGVKYSRVANLADDLCMAMETVSVRIDRIPGKSTIGIEISKLKREVIFLREVIESDDYEQKYRDSGFSPLMIALGKTIDGTPYATDLAKMPHLLIAGTTGSGKSVMVNVLICSLLLQATPSDVRMILIDPKRVELGLYEGISHLLTKVIVDPKCAANALNWAVREMETRYKQLANFGVRNISQFNHEICGSGDVARFGLDEPPTKLPYLVIVIDELGDLMMVASSEVETAITRLAQMARAVGIHLIVATQRPHRDIITPLIKANFNSRIAFRLPSHFDSRSILDTAGAESLLGDGDLLFRPPGSSELIRIHGAYVGDGEINRIVDHIRAQGGPQYNDSIQGSEDEGGENSLGERDELYDDAMRIIVQMGRASTSVLQRRLSIGYGRAAKILDMMEIEGYVGPSEGSKPREIKHLANEYVEILNRSIYGVEKSSAKPDELSTPKLVTPPISHLENSEPRVQPEKNSPLSTSTPVLTQREDNLISGGHFQSGQFLPRPHKINDLNVVPSRRSQESSSQGAKGLLATLGIFFLLVLITVKFDSNKESSKSITSQQLSQKNRTAFSSKQRLEFVLIPEGRFLMGSDNGKDDEKPVHWVRISEPFYLGKYEVTQEQWQEVMGSNPSYFKGEDLPVEQVSWDDVQEFIKRLNGRGEGTYRLPTQAEWEYACRAGTIGDYAGILDELGWYEENAGSTTHPVGQKSPNAWGLYDMHGNVWEWCQDWYGAYPSGSVTDPKGPNRGSYRVDRGGSWYDTAVRCRSASRNRHTPGDGNLTLGFRLLRER